MTTTLKEILETETCGRCGGSGHYSYNSMDGTMCYGCRGKRTRLTKRGQAAHAYWRWLLTADASLAQEGDRIFHDGWMTIEKISEPTTGSLYKAEDTEKLERARERGARIEAYEGRDYAFMAIEGRNLTCRKKSGSTITLGSWTGELMFAAGDCRTAMLKATADYQTKLTKAGKLRKDAR